MVHIVQFIAVSCYLRFGTAVRLQKEFQENPLCPSFPSNLKSKYSNIRLAGTGATACVYLGDKSGVSIAVKVAKMDGKFNSFNQECTEMQDLRKAACSKGQEFVALAKQFIPTCLESGEETQGGKAYITMHAAGTLGISKSERNTHNIGFDVPMQKRAFAQMVAAIYGLHGIGFAHNDLRGNNIVFDARNELALIDFGDVTPMQMAYSGAGLKRDANAVWRWGAALAGCSDLTYKYLKTPKSRQDEPRQKILDCVKNAWTMDDASIEVFETIIVTSGQQTKEQHIQEMYSSPFVKEHLPKLKSSFPWDKTKGCLSWDWSSIEKTWEVKECSELPNYAGQCKIDVHPGGCFNPNGEWGCFAPGNERSPANCRAKGYEGSCVHASHGKVLTEADVPDCDSNCAAKCTAAGKEGMWGACYTRGKKECLCVETGANGGAPLKYLKQSCSTRQIGTQLRTFDGLCKLSGSKWVDAPSTQRSFSKPAARVVHATTTTQGSDRSLLNTPACECQNEDIINGKSTGGRKGCNYHLTKQFGKFCYITGGVECPGAKFSKKLDLHWRKCR